MSEKTAETREMEAGEFQQIEHEIQVGKRDTLPDGRTVAEVQKGLVDLQKQQDEERAAKVPVKKNPASNVVEVHVAENGVMSARPVADIPMISLPSNSSGSGDSPEPDNDLPAEFPGRKALIAAGIVSLEAVGKLDRDALIAVQGIGDKTADDILAYGKNDAGGESTE